MVSELFVTKVIIAVTNISRKMFHIVLCWPKK